MHSGSVFLHRRSPAQQQCSLRNSPSLFKNRCSFAHATIGMGVLQMVTVGQSEFLPMEGEIKIVSYYKFMFSVNARGQSTHHHM